MNNLDYVLRDLQDSSNFSRAMFEDSKLDRALDKVFEVYCALCVGSSVTAVVGFAVGAFLDAQGPIRQQPYKRAVTIH